MIDVLCVCKSGGVYSITNLVNGKRYIGSAMNFKARWSAHRTAMAKGAGNVKLRMAVEKYGIAKFIFEPLIICSKKDLLFYEQRSIETFNSVDVGYNCRRIPHSNIGLRLPRSEETKIKIGLSNKGKLLGRPSLRIGMKQTEKSRHQMSLTKRNIFKKYELNGESMCLSDWAEKIGITTRALGNRLSRGWSIERALTEPSRGY